jgi:hypothetical protein
MGKAPDDNATRTQPLWLDSTDSPSGRSWTGTKPS